MRLKRVNQQWLRPSRTASKAKEDPEVIEIERMSEVLDCLPDIDEIYTRAVRDLAGGRDSTTGQRGLAGEQVLRAAMIRDKFGFGYRELALFINQALVMRDFVRLEPTDSVSKSALQRDIRAISEETWKMLQASQKQFAQAKEIEDGETVRSDTTATATNIHYPTDSSLMCDSIRVLTRIMTQAQRSLSRLSLRYSDHNRRAKKRLYTINTSKKGEQRRRAYADLIKVCSWVQNHAKNTLEELKLYSPVTEEEQSAKAHFICELEHYLPLCERVGSQAVRRVLLGEQVPAEEKVFSIFEPHTDIICKGGREDTFGHKVCLTSGKSGLILDCEILDGNPRDSDLVSALIERHKDFYGKVPTAMAFDGGFASADAAKTARSSNVEHVVLGKPAGAEAQRFTATGAIFKMLSKFRAGIEGSISALKRKYGFRRVLARGLKAFKNSLHCGVCTYNLTLLSRSKLAFA